MLVYGQNCFGIGLNPSDLHGCDDVMDNRTGCSISFRYVAHRCGFSYSFVVVVVVVIVIVVACQKCCQMFSNCSLMLVEQSAN